MNKKIILICSICLCLASCSTYRYKTIKPLTIPELKLTQAIPISNFEIFYLVKNLDTINTQDIICKDSTLFTQILKDIKVPDFCVDMYIQGKTYYSVNVNNKGDFENLKVLRKFDNCLDDIENQINLNLKNTNVLSEEFYDVEITFIYILTYEFSE